VPTTKLGLILASERAPDQKSDRLGFANFAEDHLSFTDYFMFKKPGAQEHLSLNQPGSNLDCSEPTGARLCAEEINL